MPSPRARETASFFLILANTMTFPLAPPIALPSTSSSPEHPLGAEEETDKGQKAPRTFFEKYVAMVEDRGVSRRQMTNRHTTPPTPQVINGGTADPGYYANFVPAHRLPWGFPSPTEEISLASTGFDYYWEPHLVAESNNAR